MSGNPKTGPRERKLTARLLCDRYGVCDRTLDRWLASGILPKPMRINRIRFWDEASEQAVLDPRENRT
jgi:hypothetical protein